MTTPFVSVIIPVRNEAGFIEECLQNVLDQDWPKEQMEVIVADGRSDDDTGRRVARVATRDPRVRIVDNPEGIVSTGLNRAIGVSRGGVVVRMDAHSSYAPDYVRCCVDVLDSTGASNVGGPARTRPSASSWGRAIAAAYHSPFAVGGARFHDVDFEGSVDTVPYGCWPRSVFDRFGLFDEALVRNQDDEHNLRILRGGGVVWQSPSIRSWYTPRKSLGALWRQYMQYGYWKVRVIRKHRIPASPRHLVPALFVAGAAAGWTTALFSHVLFGAYLGTLALYFGLVGTFSVATARRSGWGLLPRLPLVFMVYHFSYGWGFLRGVLEVRTWRKIASSSMTELTRDPVRSPE